MRKRVELEHRVWEMAADGATFREMAKELGCSHEWCRQTFHRVEAREHEELKARGLAVKASQFERHAKIARLSRQEFLRSIEPRQQIKLGPDGEEVVSKVVTTAPGNLNALWCEMAALRAQRDLLGLDVDPAANEEDYSRQIAELEEQAAAEKKAWEAEQAKGGTDAAEKS
jgi:hypothetical protein